MKAYFELECGTVIETDMPHVWAGDAKAKRISAAKGKEKLIKEAHAHLRKWIKPGMTIYTTLDSCSRSGMSRTISAFIIRKGEPWDISGYAARLIGSRTGKGGGVVMGGCGMDMGFALVYSLSRSLFRDSFICIGEGCPSNDHSNGDRDRSKHKHSDGGYALRHRWM